MIKIKKLKKIIAAIIVIFFCIWYMNYTVNRLKNTVQVDTSALKQQLEQYKKAEHEEELRRLHLQQLQNPEIITRELKQVGILIVNQGTATYDDVLQDSKWYGNKSLDIHLKYNFGIGFNLASIKIEKFILDTPVLYIPLDEIKLEYLELDANESKASSNKSWFASQFRPEDLNTVMDQAQSSIRNKITNDKSTYANSLISLKDSLKTLILKLGYKDVQFVN
jgi:hypothetical protein